jgi:polysaccharide chain length determinant protein (PEP-CTERM system associated)
MFEDESKEKNIALEDYLKILKRRRWWLLLPFFCGWVLVWSLSWILPPTYRSETVILVERQKVPEQYVVPNVAVDLQERLQSMTQQILSRTRLEKIIEELHLYPNERTRLGPDQVVDKMRNDIAIDLVEAPNKKGELTAFKISYAAANSKLAQQVTSELTSLFIDENLRARQQQSESTTSFLQAQLANARKDLDEQEGKLKEYKTEYLGQLPEQLQSNVQILSGLQGQLSAAQQALHQAEQQKIYLDSMASNYRSLASTVGTDGNTAQSTEDQLLKLRAQLADYSSRYTDNYPDVIHLKEQIAKLEKMQKADAAKAAKDAAANNGDPHPTTFSQLQAMSPIMQIQGQIKANDVEIQNRRAQVDQLQKQVDSYSGRLNLTPLREQQLADLTRNHQQALDNYQSLLAKEMQSELATNLEKRQEGEQFSIIDPPSLPLQPDSPNRFTFSILGLAVGLVLAIGLTFGLEFVQDRIKGEKEVAAMLGVPILAGIPLVRSERQKRMERRRAILEGLTAVALLAIVIAGNIISFVLYYKPTGGSATHATVRYEPGPGVSSTIAVVMVAVDKNTSYQAPMKGNRGLYV